VRALTGAVRACYPSYPRDQVISFAQDVYASALATNASRTVKRCLDMSKPVSKAGGMTGDQFMEKMAYVTEGAFLKIAGKQDAVKKALADKGICQWHCAKDAIRESAHIIWGTELQFGKEHVTNQITDAITGAIKACYPAIPRNDAFSIAASCRRHQAYGPQLHRFT